MVARNRDGVRLRMRDQYFVTVFNTNVNKVVEITSLAKAKLLATVSVQHSALIQVRMSGACGDGPDMRCVGKRRQIGEVRIWRASLTR